jgi:hypothetical protein
VIYSTDNGDNWTPGASGVAVALNGVATDGAGTWVAVGQGTTTIIVSSDNGATWAAASSTPANAVYEVTYDGTQFVVVGDDYIAASPDGQTGWDTNLSAEGGVFYRAVVAL